MAARKKPKDRRRWSPPSDPDPKQKEFVQPFARRESDAVKSQVQGWLKLAEQVLTDKNDQEKKYVP
jgi:hypothetical protein